MHRIVAAARASGPAVVRAERVACSPETRADRTLSTERAAIAHDYDDALNDAGASNYRVAEGSLGVTESVVRRMRAGAYPIGLAALAMGPAGVFRSVLVRAVLRAMGRTGAIGFFAECLAAVTKEER